MGRLLTMLLFSRLQLLLLISALLPCPCRALFQEDAGQLDFTVVTAGHGPTRFVHAHKSSSSSSSTSSSIITSDSTSVVVHDDEVSNISSSSCYIASRDMNTGKVLWRRNVCSSSSAASDDDDVARRRRHAVAVVENADSMVVTVDWLGIVRAWSMDTGALLWDAQVQLGGSSSSSNKKKKTNTNNSEKKTMLIPQIWSLEYESQYFIIVNLVLGSTKVAILNAATGLTEPMGALPSAAADPLAWPSHRIALLTKPSAAAATLGEMTPIETTCTAMNLVVAYLPRAGALAVQTVSDATPMTLQSDFALTSQHDAVHSMTVLDCQDDSMVILLSTRRGTTAQITVTKMSNKNDSFQAATIWTTEEGVSSIQSALLLDTSHVVAVADDNDETAAAKNVASLLSFSSRIQSHYKSLLTFLGILPQSDADAINSRRDSFFGFLKVAVLLGKHNSHCLYGMSTSAGQGHGRGSLLYRLDLPETATWTRLIHGTTNSVMARHGINGATHVRAVLVLSSSPSVSATETGQQLDWICVDGTTGSIHTKGSFTVPSPVLQVIPMANPTTTSSCRQGAMLVLQDYSTVLVPHDDDAMKQAAHDVINSSSGENGLYAHAIFDNKPSSSSSPQDNHAAASLQSLFIPKTTSVNDKPKARLMGTALFLGEQVIAVAYPPRDEVIQSPCTVLGDDSLLLKYMNPHLMVMMTMTTTLTSIDDKKQKKGGGSVATERDLFSAALRPEQKVSSSTPQKRKPIGVTTNTAQNETAAATPSLFATESDETPNMFVNVMDSVSGRVLYRASHANVVAMSPKPSMLISENWIFYTFMNARTRRAEIGVLSLYEGMIDRQGLTAFTRPEQSTQFSSWNARESQPVVLAKTFSIHKPATALGVTQTRGGISGRRLLVATLDGNVYAMERNALEPRRPLGPLKDSEKKEGLRQYSELLPTISYMSLSYHQVIESVQGIISAPTDLESQTMILAYGGPDLFYTRTSPSRGFDLLPDSFNRILLSIGVVGLVVLLLFVQSRVASKIQKQGWV